MENTIGSTHTVLSGQQSAVRNGSRAANKIKLILVWLAVGLPLLWGAVKALEDIGSLPL